MMLFMIDEMYISSFTAPTVLDLFLLVWAWVRDVVLAPLTIFVT